MNAGTAFIKFMADLNPLRKDFKSAQGETDKFVDKTEKGVGRIGKAFGGLKSVSNGIFQGIGIELFNKGMELAGKITSGFKTALLDLNNAAEAAEAKINAFTKNANVTADILAAIRSEASKTPFAFQEMANATSALLPVAKSANIQWMDLLKTAEILAASNPMQGLEGASFALKEAMTGDFASIIERFNLSRITINQWKEEGLSNFEIVQRAMKEMSLDSDLVAAMAETMAGKWSTFLDTLDNFKIALTKPVFDFLKIVLTDVQGLLDGNAEAGENFAATMGTKLAAGLTSVYNWLKTLGPAAKTFIGFLQEIKSDVMELWGAFQQLRGVIFEGDFKSGGPFEEDAPLITGLLRVRSVISELIERYDTLREKMLAPIEAKSLSAADRSGGIDTSKLAVGGIALGGIAIAGAGLAHTLGPLIGMFAPLISGFISVATAAGPVIIVLGLLAAAAFGLYKAWDSNLFGLRDKTQETFSGMQETLNMAKEGFSQKFDEMVTALEPLKTEFLGFWKNELGPALDGAGFSIQLAFGNIKESILALVHSEGLKNFQQGIQDLWAAVQPPLASLGQLIRADLGPAILEVVNFVGLMAGEFGMTATFIIDTMEPLFNWLGDRLSGIAKFVSDHSDQITTILRSAWGVISGLIQIAWDLISGIIVTGLRLLRGDWDGAWNQIKQTANDVWEGIKNLASNAWTFIKVLFQVSVDAIKLIAGEAWDWIKQKLDQVWEGIKDAAGKAWEWVRDRTQQIGGEIKQKAADFIDGILQKVNDTKEAIKSAILWPFEQARDLIGGIAGAFADKMKGGLNTGIRAWNGMGGKIADVFNWVARALGMDSHQINYQPVPELAKGTPNWRGGLAWVGDGNGGSGAELAWLPPGAVVIPHEESMAMVRRGEVPMHSGGRGTSTMAEFAFGLGDLPSPLDIFKNGPKWLLEKAMGIFGLNGLELPGAFRAIGDSVFKTIAGWLGKAVANFVKAAFPVDRESVNRMIKYAESQIGLPYIWGGGHGNDGTGIGFDCSGFVAAVLNAGGFTNPMGIVTSFYEWMKGGRTGIVDIGISNPYGAPDEQHTGIGLLNQWYEAGGLVGGVGRTSDYFPIVGHPPQLGNIDVDKSLKNMATRGAVGQWSGVRAMANGGMIDEPVAGVGLDTGIAYLLGEVEKEAVIPAHLMPAVIGYFQEAMMTGNYNNTHLLALPLELRPLLRQVAQHYMPQARTIRANAANKRAGTPKTIPGITRTGPIIATPPPPVTPLDMGITPATTGGTGSLSGGGATISIQIVETINMPDGSVITRKILTNPMALSELTAGVTEVQAQEIERKTTGGVTSTPPHVAEPY